MKQTPMKSASRQVRVSVKASILTGAAFAVGRVTAMASNLVLATVCGPTWWGVHALVRSTTELGIVWARGGVELSAFRWIPSASSQEQSALALRLLSSGLLLLVFATVALTTFLFAWTAAPQHLLHLVLVILSGVPLLFVGAIPCLVAATGRTRGLFAEQFWMPVFRLALFFAFVAFGTDVLSALAASLLLSATTIALWSAAGATSVFAWLPPYTARLPPHNVTLVETTSLGTNVALASLAARVDVVIAASLLSIADAGTYALVASAASFVTFVASTAGRIFAPRLSRLLDESKLPAAVAALHSTKRLAFFAGTSVGLLVQGGLLFLLPIVGFRYDLDVSLAIAVLTLSFALAGGYGNSGYMLSIRGHAHEERIVLLVYAISFVIACMIGALSGWLTGIALGCLISTSLMLFLRDRRITKLYEYSISITGRIAWWRVAAGAIIAGGLFPTIFVLTAQTGIATLIGVSAVSYIASLALMLPLLTLSKDRRRLQAMARRKIRRSASLS